MNVTTALILPPQMNLMREMGIEIIEFTDEERAAMASDIRENVWPQLAKNMGEDFINQIFEMMKQD